MPDIVPVTPKMRRSRKGAWIEICAPRLQVADLHRRSRKGAWIEIAWRCRRVSALSCRSRKGAWIEIALTGLLQYTPHVAPARERGLKCVGTFVLAVTVSVSLPQGSVD